MRLKMKLGACLVAALIVGVVPASLAGATPLPATANASTAAPARVAAYPRPHTVTLITGDRLTVSGTAADQVSVAPGPGRARITFVVRTEHGHLHVTPSDALPLVNAGRLDRQLFDVTTLIQFGYDDQRADLPLIVAYQNGGRAKATTRAALGTVGSTVGRDLPAVGGVAVKQHRRTATTFWNSLTGGAGGARAAAPHLGIGNQVGRLWLDGVRTPSLDVSVPQIGAPLAWQAGFTGAGVGVAVVDTGIDSTHPDLAGRVAAAQNFTDDGDNLDHVGHGTHVASTIAGSAAASNGRYKGVAPDVRLYDAKVCTLQGCPDSAILAGMQWATADQHAKVVNMSLGGPDTPGIDPIEQAVQDLTAQYGTLFVIAVGNAGADGTVGSPASADDALSVGAVSKTDELAPFSSRGPRVGDFALKPDITAPGVAVTAARGKDGVYGNPGDLYTTISGTSMAAPHVAGSAAILAQQHPDWPPARLKAGLMAAAKPNPAIGVYAQGAGRVDIGRAVRQAVTTTPVSLSFGQQEWPHTDDNPITKTVSYHNYGAAPVTFSLALHTTGPDGTPTPAGMFTVSASTLTVPAGGDASVTVTADTRVDGPDGFLGGQLTATAGDIVVQTPLAVVREAERYDVTLTHLDRAGQPTTDYDTVLVGLDRNYFVETFNQGSTVKLRVPKGRYLLASLLFGGTPDHPALSLLVQPVLDVSSAQTLTLDARQAKPVSVKIPRADATQLVANLGFEQRIGDFGFGGGLFGQTFDGMYSAQIGPPGPFPGFSSNVSGQWGRVQPDGNLLNSPYAYLLSWFEQGRMITGFQRTVAARDLATVHVDMAAEATGAQATKLAFGSLPGGSGGGFSVGFPYTLPASRTEYYNTDSGIQWGSLFIQQVPSTDPQLPFPMDVSFLVSAPTRYEAGRPYHETWNQAVFGPALPARPIPQVWLTRTGDSLIVDVPLYGDNAGRLGFSRTDEAKLTIYRDGTKLVEQNDVFGQFILPPDPASYRVELGTSRGAPFTLSTRTSVAWTFRSQHVDGDQPVALPVSVPRFLPDLDLRNTAKGELSVPILVARQPGAAPGHTDRLAVDVSFDDGAHWTKAIVTRLGDGGLAVAKHPSGHGFVSLRASVSDDTGNTVEETITRAYRF